MAIIVHGGHKPALGEDVFIAEGAMLIGDVTVGSGSSIWFNAVVRGDVGPVILGRMTNVQDNCVLHTDRGEETRLGDYVLVGHGAIVHSAKLGDGVLVGMNAVVLNNAEVGEGSIIGAGAVVPAGKKIPPRSLVLGVPGKVARELSAEEAASIREQSERYAGYAKEYLKGGRS